MRGSDAGISSVARMIQGAWTPLDKVPAATLPHRLRRFPLKAKHALGRVPGDIIPWCRQLDEFELATAERKRRAGITKGR